MLFKTPYGRRSYHVYTARVVRVTDWLYGYTNAIIHFIRLILSFQPNLYIHAERVSAYEPLYSGGVEKYSEK